MPRHAISVDNRKLRTTRGQAHRRRVVLGHLEQLEPRTMLTSNLAISEIHFEPGFGSQSEYQYVELRGTPNATIPGGTYFVAVDSDHDEAGEINSVFNLGGLAFGSSGFLAILQANAGYAVDPGATVIQGTTDGFDGIPNDRFANDTTVTSQFEHVLGSTSFLLIQSPFEPIPDDDVDANDDGVFDSTGGGWSVLDSVSVLGVFLSGDTNDISYGDIVFRADGNTASAPAATAIVDVETASYVARVGGSIGSSADAWMVGRTEEITQDGFDFEVTSGFFGDPVPLAFGGLQLDHLGATNFNFSTVLGSSFVDSNRNGTRDVGEGAIDGVTVYLDRNDNGAFDTFGVVADADGFSEGDLLRDSFENATLGVASVSNSINSTEVVRAIDFQGSTGSSSFGHGPTSSQSVTEVFTNTDRLRIDFAEPVESISIDAVSVGQDSIGILEIYDAEDVLLGSSGPQLVESVFPLTLISSSPDIAYAVAYSTTMAGFDNLEYSFIEQSTSSTAQGFALADIPDAFLANTQVKVRALAPEGFEQIPLPGTDGGYEVLFDTTTTSFNNNFGFAVDEYALLDVTGRANGNWFVGGSNGTQFNTESTGTWSTAVNWGEALVGDFDGDGFDDVAARAGANWWVGRSTDAGLNNQLWGSWSTAVTWEDILVGDFNGDGMDDIAGRANGSWWVATSNGNGFGNVHYGNWSNAVQWDDVQVADVNGDDKDDIIGRANGGWWAAVSIPTGFGNLLMGNWSNAVAWTDVSVGDFNGDGNDDVIGRANGSWWLARSTGQNFVSEYWGSWSNSVQWQDVLVADFNGDWSDDIAGRANGNWWIATSTGSSLLTKFWGSWSSAIDWEDVDAGDFDGDGDDDLVGRANGTWWVARSTGTDLRSEYWGQWSDAVNWVDVNVGRFRVPATAGGAQAAKPDVSTQVSTEDSSVSEARRSGLIDAFFASDSESFV